MSCPRLTTIRALAPKKLIKLAFKCLPYATLQAVFATLHPTQHRILQQQRRRNVSLNRLADTLYYHRGATLSRLSRWNEMTKLQMQHELLKRGTLDKDEKMTSSEWKLRIRLVCVVTEERKARGDGEMERTEREEEARREWIAQCSMYEELDKECEAMEVDVATEEGIEAV